MRVAVPGGEDILEFTRIHQVWVSEDCEPVQIEFAWQRHPAAAEAVSEADFICSHDLAAHLLHLLWTDSDEDVAAEPVTPEAGLASLLARRLMLN